jgi:hypothetical protein
MDALARRVGQYVADHFDESLATYQSCLEFE